MMTLGLILIGLLLVVLLAVLVGKAMAYGGQTPRHAGPRRPLVQRPLTVVRNGDDIDAEHAFRSYMERVNQRLDKLR